MLNGKLVPRGPKGLAHARETKPKQPTQLPRESEN